MPVWRLGLPIWGLRVFCSSLCRHFYACELGRTACMDAALWGESLNAHCVCSTYTDVILGHNSPCSCYISIHMQEMPAQGWTRHMYIPIQETLLSHRHSHGYTPCEWGLTPHLHLWMWIALQKAFNRQLLYHLLTTWCNKLEGRLPRCKNKWKCGVPL